jgi:hypothetical protein
MAVKTKSNRKKSKGRARRAAPLLGRNGDVRRSDTMTRSLPERSPAASVVGDMTLPVRLMSQLPLQVWRVQMLLAYQGLMMMRALAFGRPIGSLPMP